MARQTLTCGCVYENGKLIQSCRWCVIANSPYSDPRDHSQMSFTRRDMAALLDVLTDDFQQEALATHDDIRRITLAQIVNVLLLRRTRTFGPRE